MGIFGNILGSGLGSAAGQIFGGDKGRQAGGQVGGILGNFLPFKEGGMVKKTTQKALLHKGELVVPKHLVKKVSKSLKKEIKMNGGRNM